MTGKARPGQVSTAAVPAARPPRTRSAAAAKSPAVRVTLNIPPDLYRQLRKWTDAAADEIGVPQVGQQDALRAMLGAAIHDKTVGLVVIDLLRREGR